MKIGITLDMSNAFWANGMQQNIVFLHQLLKRGGHDCYYITHEKPAYILNKKHKGMMLNDVLSDSQEKFDVIIIAGFDLLPQMYDALKARNQNLKVILVHFGNKMMDDIHYGIAVQDTQRIPLSKPKYLSQIWISPHHKYGQEYLKAYYNFEDIRVIPYIWEPFFIEEKIKDLESKNLNPFFSAEKIANICIFEPNISHLKNCIIPITICQTLDRLYPNTLKSVTAFSSESVRSKNYFKKLMHQFEMTKKDKFCYFANRWSSFDALSKFGSTVVSHQCGNELNYSYLEALHLGLPLIHNSPPLMNVGYYYEDFNVKMGANQLYSAILNHEQCLDDYKKDARSFIKKFDPFLSENIAPYNSYLNEIK